MCLSQLAVEKQSAQNPHSPAFQSGFKVVVMQNFTPKYHSKSQTSKLSESRFYSFISYSSDKKKNKSQSSDFLH